MFKTAAGALLAFLLIGCGGNPSGPAPAEARARVGSPAPAFTLMSVSGKKVSLADFKGKVVLLDFWATWCPPCRASTPALVRLGEKYKGKDFTVVGISLDEDRDAVGPYLKKEKVRHPVLFGADSTIDRDYGVRAIPSFFIVDRDGVVRKQYAGFYPAMERDWEKMIEQLLAK